MARAYKNANSEIQVEVPVRTGTDPKGGVLLGLDHLSLPELAADVAAPSSTRGRLYVKDASGRTKVFLRDSTGVVRLLDENDGASGAAGGDLSGTYPNPSIAAGAVGTSKLADNAVTQAKASIGSGSTQLAGGDDSRFPTAGQKNALAGTDGTPGTGNEYLTKSGIGSRVQAWDADLDAVAALATLAFGRGLLELANAAAVQTYIGLGSVATLASDTDGTLAANSDSRVATQKAGKTYADGIRTAILAADEIVVSRATNLSAQNANTFAIPDNGATNTLLTGTASGRAIIPYFDPAKYAIAGFDTKLVLTGLIVPNDVAPGGTVTFSIRLVPVATYTGGAAAGTITAGAAVATVPDLSTATPNLAGAQHDEVVVAAPSAGIYALIVVTTNNMAANSQVQIEAQVRIHRVPS